MARVISQDEFKAQFSAAQAKTKGILESELIHIKKTPPSTPGAAAVELDYILGLPGFQITSVPSIGPGDEDVHTKSGRHTVVTVRTEGMSVTADRRKVQFIVLYRVEEVRSDFTTLERRQWVTLSAPVGWKIKNIRPGLTNVRYRHDFIGEDHKWHDASEDVDNTYFDWLSIKFDGPGDDDQGNAQLAASITVPVTLQQG